MRHSTPAAFYPESVSITNNQFAAYSRAGGLRPLSTVSTRPSSSVSMAGQGPPPHGVMQGLGKDIGKLAGKMIQVSQSHSQPAQQLPSPHCCKSSHCVRHLEITWEVAMKCFYGMDLHAQTGGLFFACRRSAALSLVSQLPLCCAWMPRLGHRDQPTQPIFPQSACPICCPGMTGGSSF